jgi:hypothetical protein
MAPIPAMKAFVYALLIPAFAPTLAESRSPVSPLRVSTKLRRSTETAGYVVDILELPEAHPGGPPLDVGGFDFFPDGRLALGTSEGDVWVAHGIGSDVIQWRRFATGLRGVAGLTVVSGGVRVASRDGIVRLRDPDMISGADLQEVGENLLEHAKAPGATPEGQGKMPFFWIPSQWGDSAGGWARVPSEGWGPWKDQLLLFRDGNTALLGVLREEVRGSAQGGILAFPLTFPSGILRGRFNPADGQLYVSGRRVSSSGGVRGSWLQRVRYTGGAVRMPVEFRAERKGVTLRFGCDLDTETAADPGHYRLEILHEAPHGALAAGTGSPRETSPEGAGSGPRKLPSERSPDGVQSVLRVESVSVGTDDKSVFLEVPDLQPPLRMRLSYRLRTVEGLELRGEFFPTVHVLRESE